MGAPQYEQAGADVAGSGTPGTIPVWSSGTTLGDSVIKQSGTFVGFNLGANAPLQELQTVVPNTGGTPSVADWLATYAANGDRRSGFGFNFSAVQADNKLVCFVSNGTTTGQTAVWTADGSGNVGIGTASPGARLHVLDSVNAQHTIFSSTNASRGYTEYRYNTSASLGYFGTANGITTGGASADFAWRVETGGSLVMAIGTTERARVTTTGLDVSTSGYGLKLPATPGNTDPNTLDAYADGGTANSGGVTWTPTLKFGGATTGIVQQTTVGRYTRVGNMIFAQCHITLSNKGSATGVATIDGLPAMANLNSLYAGAAIAYVANITFGDQLTAIMFFNETWVRPYKATSGGATTQLTDADFANNSAIIFTICYPVT